MTLAHEDTLFTALSNYRTLINETARMRSLLKGWDRDVVISCNDSGEIYTTSFSSSFLSDITKVVEEDVDAEEDGISLAGTRADLIDIFTGNENPAKAFLNGKLAVFSTGQDQVKLDSISLILWGSA